MPIMEQNKINHVKPVPEGYPTITPYMIIQNAGDAIAFYKKAFGAAESMRITDEDGKIHHAEIRIGSSPVMIVDEFQEFPYIRSPRALGGASVHLYLYVEDVDSLFEQAIAAGAQVLEPLKDHDDGDRRGGLTDPFGHVWWMASRINGDQEAELR